MGAARAEGLRTLVPGTELAGHPEWRVFDCRHDLAKPDWGLEEYRRAHIPGALFAHLDRDLSAPKTGKNGRHPLPALESFVLWIGSKGIKPTDQIICYDQGSGTYAARLWWMLRGIGHERVAVLDGGLVKWLKEGRPVNTDIPAFAATAYPLRPKPIYVDVGYVESCRDDTLLLDARAPARYRGELEPIDPVAGHIPGALNWFNNENLQADGTFKDPGELKRNFQNLIGKHNPAEIVHYCGSGVAACHNALAMEIAGLEGSRVYIGSWSEWIADPKRPIAR